MTQSYDLGVHIAKLYYEQRKTQQEIADILGLSRPQVSRLLKKAHERGIVSIVINDISIRETEEIREKFIQVFKLKDAVIINTPKSDEDLKIRALGYAGARYVEKNIEPKDTVGVAWGRTLLSLVNNLRPNTHVSGIKVVQMIGGLSGVNNNSFPFEISHKIAEAFNAEHYVLAVPLIVEDKSIKTALLQSPMVAETVKMWECIDMAIFGIGTISKESPIFKTGCVPPAIREKILKSGGVGDIACRFFNLKGQKVCQEIDELVLGIEIDKLKAVKKSIAIAGGKEKVLALLGALRTGACNVVITDYETCQELLKLV